MRSVVLSLLCVLALQPGHSYCEIPLLREDQLRETATHILVGKDLTHLLGH